MLSCSFSLRRTHTHFLTQTLSLSLSLSLSLLLHKSCFFLHGHSSSKLKSCLLSSLFTNLIQKHKISFKPSLASLTRSRYYKRHAITALAFEFSLLLAARPFFALALQHLQSLGLLLKGKFALKECFNAASTKQAAGTNNCLCGNWSVLEFQPV